MNTHLNTNYGIGHNPPSTNVYRSLDHLSPLAANSNELNRQSPSAGNKKNRQTLIQNGSDITSNGKLSTLISLYGNSSAMKPTKKYSLNIENGNLNYLQLTPTGMNRESAMSKAFNPA